MIKVGFPTAFWASYRLVRHYVFFKECAAGRANGRHSTVGIVVEHATSNINNVRFKSALTFGDKRTTHENSPCTSTYHGA